MRRLSRVVGRVLLWWWRWRLRHLLPEWRQAWK